MTGDQGLWLVYGAMCLILVGSALVVRSRDRGTMLRMAAIWAMIFAVAVLLAGFFGWRR